MPLGQDSLGPKKLGKVADEYAQMLGILTPEQYGALVPEPDDEDRLMELSSVPEPDDEDRLMEFSSDGDSRRLQGGYKINWVEKGKVLPVKH